MIIDTYNIPKDYDQRGTENTCFLYYWYVGLNNIAAIWIKDI